ncbi:MAG: sodium:calcium antiporter [Chloroflexi bacterium]|nr:sodium:calcium antiporter [Chloroflexota bacterium]
MPSPERDPKNWLWLALALAAGVPALYFSHLGPGHLEGAGPAALVFGLGIVGAAFLLAWASETAQLDISQALALAVVALLAVLPEYAVDMVFAWKAGLDPQSDYVHYAAANMTGGNRLLVGIGWPLVVFLFWFSRRAALRLERDLSLELVFLAAATLYAFTIPLKGSIALWDAAVLIGLFVAYMWMSARAKAQEPELVGPSAALAALGRTPRRGAVLFLFAYAALVIILSAEPFADGLVQVGTEAGIDQFLMVQWVAPLASESPEILVAAILTMRGQATAAMTALVSSKVNQWTLLVGSLPVVFSVAGGTAQALPLGTRQMEEFFLTSAQSLFAVVLLVRMHISWRGALALFVLFLTQVVIPDPRVRLAFAFVYLAATVWVVAADWGRVREFGRLGRAVVGSLLGRTAP